MSKQLTITISPDGSDVKIEAEGYVGESCKDATASLIRAIGTLTENTDKPELYHSYLPGGVVNSNGN
jgi:hypothetical protein